MEISSSVSLQFIVIVALWATAAHGTGVGSLSSFPSFLGLASSFVSPQAPQSGSGSELTQQEDERFEDEVKDGGCRGQLISMLQTTMEQVMVDSIPATPIPFDQELRKMVSTIASRLLENTIEENATGRNAADATATAFMVACSFRPEFVSACTAGRPMVRRAALETFRVLCRTLECCTKPSTAVSAKYLSPMIRG